MLKSIIYLTLFIISPFLKAQNTYIEEGSASFYGKELNGKKTACGERFNMNSLTAAHRTLPFNTMVKVTNLSNNKSVIVRINDRGPFSKNRIIDVSKAAALELGMVGTGTARVKIEVVETSPLPDYRSDKTATDTPKPEPEIAVEKNYQLESGNLYNEEGNRISANGYSIQIASLKDINNLKNYIEEVKQKNIQDIYVEVAEIKKQKVYRVLIGKYTSMEQAKKFSADLKAKGFSCLVKKINYEH